MNPGVQTALVIAVPTLTVVIGIPFNRQDTNSLRNEMVALRKDLTAGMSSLRKDFNADIASLRADFASLRSDVQDVSNKVSRLEGRFDEAGPRTGLRAFRRG